MSIYGNPVYLGQEGGGGGAVTVLLNEHEYKTTSGGTFSFSKTVTIEDSGTYFVAAHGYASSLTVTLNGVTQTLSFTQSNDYTFWYEDTLNLSAGDVLAFEINSSGRSAASAQVMRIG